MAIILITGVPGTGKGTISERLKKKGFAIVAVNDLVNKLHLWKKKERGSKVVDMAALEKEVRKHIRNAKKNKTDIVIEGHLLCELKLSADLCIVLRTNPTVLKKRLQKRKYPQMKTEENIEAELIDYCTQLAEDNLDCPIYEVGTSSSVSKSMHDVDLILKGKGKKLRAGWINWTDQI